MVSGNIHFLFTFTLNRVFLGAHSSGYSLLSQRIRLLLTLNTVLADQAPSSSSSGFLSSHAFMPLHCPLTAGRLKYRPKCWSGNGRPFGQVRRTAHTVHLVSNPTVVDVSPQQEHILLIVNCLPL